LSLVIHLPTCISQQGRDPAIAVSAILLRQLDHIGNQAIFVRTSNRNLALRGSVLPQNPASAAF
jgi:hypothetical protein